MQQAREQYVPGRGTPSNKYSALNAGRPQPKRGTSSLALAPTIPIVHSYNASCGTLALLECSSACKSVAHTATQNVPLNSVSPQGRVNSRAVGAVTSCGRDGRVGNRGHKEEDEKTGQGPGRSTTVLPPRSTTQVKSRKGFLRRQAQSQDRD
ncbi:hypothetical protein MTO96_032602 [Rhipicephalus appendiculatus]